MNEDHTDESLAFLADVLPEDRVSRSEDVRDSHATDWGTDEGTTPDAVVWPETTEEVSAILSGATEHGIPVTPYAAGTSLEGNPVPAHAGISMDLTRMDVVLEVRPEDHQIDVEPGVMGPAIEDAAGEHGLFFPPLPSSGDISTIGGMIANAASGMQTVKYGEIADWVLELEAVLADGSVITAGSKAVKTSSGYNLRDLLIGSEGTLAVVTRATLELAGRPQQIRGGRALFSTLDDATAAVTDAVQSGVDVAKIELIDAESARMSNAYTGADLPDEPMVFVEFHADHGIEEEIAFCESIFEAHGVERFEIADEARMDDLWRARKDLAFAVRSFDPDLEPLHPGDVTVPISEYGPLIEFAKERAAEENLLVPCFGHAGDGNVHYSVLADPDDPDEVERGEALYAEIVQRAIEVGGTATGEHGVALGKREYLVGEHGEATVEAMRAIKRALDPTDTMNPGKIFPETADGERVLEDELDE
ncbi:FAD/FMN-dependent dehydrogenase [Salinarchaeum sp. Harcht-Bsk1]|uniref:FAD-binding oxidoreductase n=1 Tax=Salinarchaeum sp. Harcht-Bsk1 TaxID=1333523 RepID=UPI0003423E46|nr:FAD-binding oxidoreductase [Salinarchaeum sp. Harcht-Bsk1]AGN00181.1 FAD/FMN-dependent dehydrogenase [Salinarchaeum sp. Harcht-Bsk1]